MINKSKLILIVIVICSATVAEAGPYNKPIYNPETKSYFELYNPTVKTPGAKKAYYDPRFQWFWEQARRIAARKIYRGVRGRLAVVKTRSVHEFLRTHFTLGEPAWIGLRYWCKYHKLLWVTGELQKLTAFSNWGAVWDAQGAQPNGPRVKSCVEVAHGGIPWLPVHYWPTKDGFYWNANGYRKGFASMFIEYPTGKP